MPVGSLSRGGLLGSYPARHAHSRAVRYTQVCFILILGIGSLLVFSYQSEIYVTVPGKDIFASTSQVTTKPVGSRTNKPEIKVEKETSRSRQQAQVFAVPGFESEEGLEQDPDIPSVDEAGDSVTVRRLESSAPRSPSGAPAGVSTNVLSSSSNSRNSSESASLNNSRSRETMALKEKEPLAIIKNNKNDKKKAVDLTNPLYVPVVGDVHTNLISTNFRLVIKVLAVNSHGSLLRLLESLQETDFAGDRVDLHMYIDHFEINAAVEAQRKQRRRILLQSNDAPSTSRKVNVSDGEGVLELEAEISSIETEEVSEDITELEANLWVDNAGDDSVDSSADNGDKKTDRIRRKRTKRKGKHSGSRKLGVDQPSEIQENPQVPDKVKNYIDAVNANDWGIIESKLRDSRRVLALADRFVWKYGTKMVHYRSKAAGYQGQWIDSWWPSSEDEFALVVDDDMELSPLFYRYVRSVIATYYYQEAQYDPSLYGISLQRPQLVPGKSGNPIKVGVRTRLYMYEMVGIWGQVFFPKPWKEFRTWYDTKKSHDQKPILEGMVTTDWYRKYGEKMWTPWFVKFVHTRGYFSLYTNFLKNRVLSVSHRSESPRTKKFAGCDADLIGGNSTYDVDIFHMAPMKALTRYDYCFKEVLVGRFANRSTELSQVLSTVHDNKVVLMLSTLDVPESLVRNWVCVLKKLGVSNYVFFGEDLALLEDLARRGHASVRFEFNENLTEDREKEVDAVLTVLKLGYDVWFARADMIWAGNPLSLFDWGEADMIGIDNTELNMFYIRNTKETIDVWSSFHRQLNKAAQSSSRLLNFEKAREAFVQKCDSEEKIRVQSLDKVTFLSAEKLTTLPSGEGVVPAEQVVLFSQMSHRSNRDLVKKATQLNLWNLDDDLVCTHVIC